MLVADGAIENTELEERLVNIRRGTNFDSKALYFLPSASSAAELREFAKVLFSTLHPTCIEYYRDLSKHARRKRNRNNVPAPTVPPTHPPLSLQGWNVRYEFKLGVFAETRQEFEAATRNYEQAYEGLFHTELIESIPAWSARFNEARMLADVLAIRTIRCLFWSAQTAQAVRWWIRHRDRIRDLVERRGKGVQNYGWEAWMGIWSKVMAELIERADIFSAARAGLPPGSGLPIHISQARSVVGSTSGVDRSSPWESLHHEGYWLNNVREHIDRRRQLAQSIPVEDRSLDSGNNAAKKQGTMYDTYLTPDPAIESKLLEKGADSYAKRICDNIDQALMTFKARDQRRMVDVLRYFQAVEMIGVGDWSAVQRSLQPVWQSSHWRQSGWKLLLSKIDRLLLESAVHLQDHELCLLLNWELSVLLPGFKGVTPPESTPVSTALDPESMTNGLASSFTFAADTGHVGESVPVQFSVRPLSSAQLFGMRLIEVKIAFDGGINPILLKPADSDLGHKVAEHDTLFRIELSEVSAVSSTISKRLSINGGSYWLGEADLTLNIHGYSVYCFDVTPREAGPVSVASITMLVSNGSQEITINAANTGVDSPRWWELRNERVVEREFGMHRNVSAMNVLPKPPKVEIEIKDLSATYYTNEKIILDIQITNHEEESVHGQLFTQFIGADNGGVSLQWLQEDIAAISSGGPDEVVTSLLVEIEPLETGATRSLKAIAIGVIEPIDHELEIKFAYTLQSDNTTLLNKDIVVDLPVIRPFEANAFFYPRLHSDQWPDFFSSPESDSSEEPKGLKQVFKVRADIASFATDPLRVHRLELIPRRLVGGAVSKCGSGTHKQFDEAESKYVEMKNEETAQFHFDLELQKLALGNRAPVTADYAIDVHWSRTTTPDDINISTLLLPKLLAPMSEPRVLLGVEKQENVDNVYLLTYTIENPSMHFLTFNVSFESGDGFAFSGPKSRSISLVPISRYTIDYRILMQKNKEWVNIQLNVLDAFFGQVLKVVPASDGIRVDKQGQIQIWSDKSISVDS